MPKIYHSLEVLIGSSYKEFTLEIAVTIGNDGIGAYECHGGRGYDYGTDYIEEWTIESVTYDGTRLSLDSFKVITDGQVQKQIEESIVEYIKSGHALKMLQLEQDAS